MYSPEIAKALRDRGHDVLAAQEGTRGLRNLSDEDLLQAAVADRRALLTENIGDLAPIAHEWLAIGRDHYGVLFTSPKSMPRTDEAIGLYVRSLDEFMRSHPDEAALRNVADFLPPVRG